MSISIAIIDYGMGNLRSVQKALQRVGAQAHITQSPDALERSAAIVLPGVGAFGEAVRRLKRQRLWTPLQNALNQKKPFLGICLGYQLLFERSEENPGVGGLGFFKGSVVRFSHSKLKVPHMGWNTVQSHSDLRNRHPVLKNIKGLAYFYFVHSYYPIPKERALIATETLYGKPFASSVATPSLFACQFHPEKSGKLGMTLLTNFVNWAATC